MKNDKSQPDSGGKLDFVEECSWVDNHNGGERFVLLDCTYILPTEEKKGIKEYKKEHIPTASFFDIDSICDPETDLPHMLPTIEFFPNKLDCLELRTAIMSFVTMEVMAPWLQCVYSGCFKYLDINQSLF